MVKQGFLVISLLLLFILLPGQALAQENSPGGPVYIVQEGDTLSIIAFRFGVTVTDLVETNRITNPNQLAVGDRLVIPGLAGVEGVLTTSVVPFGESLSSLSRRYQIPAEDLVKLNRLVSPVELTVGSQVILPIGISENQLGGRLQLNQGQTMLEAAVLAERNPWEVSAQNYLSGPTAGLARDIYLLNDDTSEGPGALPPAITGVEFSSLPLVQGETSTIAVGADQSIELLANFQTVDLRNGNTITQTVPFFPYRDGLYLALQGVHAMAEPGLYPLQLVIRDQEGESFAFTQFVSVVGGGYGYDPPLTVDPKTVDSEVTQPEDEIWNALGREVTANRLWEGDIQSPSPFGDCWTSLYGSRRSYNGSAYNFFHTGLDFCGGVGIEVRAPASGVVTFAEPLVVRGNAIMIDHGWGVLTGYMHLAELLVEAGETVEAGQLIGLVGGTGRVTGAHLHWEVWVAGVQVNPATWLEEGFPSFPLAGNGGG